MSPAADVESHWLGLVLCVTFSALTLVVRDKKDVVESAKNRFH